MRNFQYLAIRSQACSQTLRWLLAMLLMAMLGSLHAATVTWTGGGADTNWSTVANWSTNPALPAVGDTVVFASGGTSVTMDGPQTVAAITLSSASDFTIDGASILTIGTVSGLTVSSDSNFTISCPVAMGASQTWTHNGAGALTVSGIVSGGFALTKAGGGPLILSGANTYTGLTNVNAGTVMANNALALGTTAAGTVVASGATLLLGNVAIVGEALTISGTGVGGAGALVGNFASAGSWSGTITLAANSTLGGSANTHTLSGVISGGFALTKVGGGTMVLSGINTFSGTLTVNEGTLRVGGGSAIPDGCAVTLANTAGAVLNLNGSSEAIGSLAGGGTTGGSVSLGAGVLTTGGNNTTTTYSGVISGSGAVIKAGSGTWTVSGTNTYTGTTTVSVGVLVINSTAALGGGGATAATGTTVASGATLQLNALTVAAEVLTLSGTGVGGNGALINSGSTGTWSGNVILAADSSLGGTTSAIIGGVISGNFALTKVGGSPCLWRLDGVNTYTGVTTISAGILAMGSSSALGDPSSGTIVASGATLRLDTVAVVGEALTLSGTGVGAAGALLGNTSFVGSWAGPITLAADSSLGGTTNTHTISGAISGAFALTKVGSGTWTLSGANNYSGTTTVSAGILVVDSATALGTTAGGTVVASGAALQVNATAAVVGEALTLSGTGIGAAGALVGSGSGGSWSGTVTMAAASSIGGTGNNTSISGVISGAFALTKVGSGTWTLSGANTYVGTTTVTLGTLQLAGGSAIPDASAVTIANAVAVLDLNDSSETVGSLAGAGPGGTVTLGTGTFTAGGNNSSTAFVGVISSAVGSGGVTKLGTGTWTLSGANTYEGATTISAGILVANHATALGSAVAGTSVTATGAALQLNAFAVVNEDLTLNGTGVGSAGALVGSGSGGSWSGAVTLQSASSIGGTGNNSSISGIISGAFALTKVGTGTWNLSGANTYDEVTTVSAGILSVQDDSALGTATFGTSVTSGATLDLTGTRTITGEALTLNGVGVGSLGALTATGSNCLWTGPVTMTAVAASLGGSGSGTISGVISGAFALTKVGSGTWTLSGANTYGGATTLSLGTLQVAGGSAIPDGSAVTIANAVAVLDLNNSDETIGSLAGVGPGGTVTLGSGTLTAGNNNTSTTFVGVITGTGGVTKGGTTTAGTWTLSGANSYDGATLVSAGTLVVNHATALGSAIGGTTVVTGAALQLNAFAVVNEALTLSGTGTGTGGALVGSGSGGSWSGTVTLQSASYIGGTGNNSTISGIISGAFALTKVGSGTWNVSGANTYDGLTTVSAGTLSVQHDSALGTTTFGTSVTSGATLDLTGTRTITGETLSLNGVGVGSLGALTATGSNCLWTGPVTMTLVNASLGGSGSATLSGTLGGGFSLTKVGSGTWTLAAANGYSGTTTVSAGTLVVADALALGTAGAGTTVTAGATLQVGAFAVVGEALTLNGTGFGGVGALVTSGIGSWSGTVGLGSNATITVAGTTTFSGIVSGAFTLTKDGAGEAQLGAVNTFSGLTIASGSVRLSGGAALNDAAVVTLANVAGVTLDLAGVSETIGALGGGGTSGGVVTLGTGTLTTGTTGSPTFDGTITGTGGLNITGSGTMTLTATSTYSGATTINGATVVLSGDTAAIPLSVSLTLSGGATVSIPGIGAANPDRIANSATVTMQGATISMSAAAGVDRSEVIGGLLFASGTNIITLVPNGVNTAVLSASGYGHSAGATLTFNPTDATLTKLFFTSASDGEVLGWSTVTQPTTGVGQYSTVNGLVVLGSSKVTVQAGDWTAAATWSPAGAPVAGDTVQVLHAVILTTDQTVVALTFGAGGSIAQQAPTGRRTLTITSGGVQVSGATSPTIDANLAAGTADVLLQHDGSGTLTVMGAISGGNLGILAGSASVRLEGANLHSGTTTVYTGTLVVANALGLASTTVGTRVADGAALVLDGVAIGAETLTVRGIGPAGIGALGATGTSSATGAVIMEAATSVGGSGTLSLSGAISGAFALTKVGSGTLVLSGSNTYSGGTTVTAGTLQAVRTSLPGAVVNNATLAISESGTGTFTAGVTGPGDFIKLDTGTLILVSPTLISGTTTVTAGTLQVSNALITGPVIDNGVLAFNQVPPAFPTAPPSPLYANVISGSGALTKLGDGVLELSGANTFTGTTTISAGTLRVSNDVVSNVPGALGNSAAAVTITGGVLEVNTANVTRSLVIGSAGGRIDAYGSARTVSSPITVSAVGTGGGLTSSIVAASLRAVLIDDWRTTFTIAGTRIDPLVNYPLTAFGTSAERAAYGISGTDADWGNFSSQWDGYLRVVTSNTSLYIRADDTVRLWIDLDNDSVQDAGELMATTTTSATPVLIGGPLAIGTYRTRLQYEEGNGGNYAQFLWNDLANSAGTVAPHVLIPASFLSGFAIGGVTTASAGGQTLTLTGTISGTGSLSKVGTSTALLNTGNTYAGGTYVIAGTLRSGAAEVIPDQALVVDALATFDLAGFAETVDGLSGRGSVALGSATLSVGSGGGSGEFSGVVSGSGGITKLGAGTQVFSGVNTYSGLTAVSAGVLAAADGLALGDAVGVTTVANGSSLEIRAVTIAAEGITLNGLGSAGSGALRATGTAVVGGTIDLASASSVITTGDLTLTGVVSGTGAWSLSGGTVHLSAANTYSGVTTVASGTLVLGNDLALGTIAGGTVVSSGATIAVNGATIVGEALTVSGSGVGGLGALSNDINGSGSWSGGITLAADATIGGIGSSTTLSGIISGSGGLSKIGSGTYVLSGDNSYTGATAVNVGTMTLAGDSGRIAASSALLIGNGASLVIDATGTLNPDRIGDAVDVTFTGGNLVMQAPATADRTETVGRLVITSGANLIDLHPTMSSLAQLTATNGFSRTNPATFTLDRNVAEGTANLFLGGVSNGGVFTWSTVIETGTAIGRYSTVDGLIGITGGLYTIANGNWTAPATWFGGVVPGAGDVVDVRHVVDLTSDQAVVSLGISLAGQITTGGGARRTLTVGAGTVTIASGSTAPSIDADLAFGSVDAVFRQDEVTNAATILGVISGSGSVAKTGNGSLRLEGANTYSGATQIAAGTVIAAHANALGTSAAGTTVDAGASLDLDGITLAAEALTLSGNGPSGAGALTTANTAGTNGTIILAADAGVGGSGTLTLGGVISGSTRRLTKLGSGTTVLSAVNTYSGGTTISAGTLRGAASAFPGDIVDQAELEFAQSVTGTYAGLISGSGSLRKTGTGTLILTGLNTYTGTSTIAAGILRVGNNVISGSAGPLGSASTAVDLAGGSLESDATTFSRPLVVSAAGVRIDVVTMARTIASPISAIGSQVLTVGNSTGATPTFSGVLSDGLGTLALVKDGSGTVILTGANSYTGGTTVSAGTLQGSATGLQGNIANATAVIFDQTGSATFNGLISGVGTVTKIGTGTVVMGAANTYSGLTTILAGTMRASADVIASTPGPFGSSVAAVVLNGGVIESDTNVFSRAISVAGAGGQLDAYGLDRTVSAPITLTNAGPGMTASIISTSLRLVTEDDWRVTQTVVGTRIDPQIHSPTASTFGTTTEFAAYAISNTVLQWEDFSIQWDGWVSVLVPNTVIYTASDDGSRAWVDANQNGTIDVGEWASNGWGAGQGVVARPVSGPLAPGLYRIRVQFEQATGGAGMSLVWNDATNSGGAYVVTGVTYHVIPTARFAPFQVGGTTVAGAAGQIMTLTGVISGSNAGLQKIGTSTVVLAAANTYGGSTLVQGGTLRAGALGALPPTPLGILATSTCDFAGFDHQIGTLSGSGALSLGTANLSVANATASLFEGVISGSGGLTKLGTATLMLSGINTFTGPIQITAGTLSARTSTAFGNGVTDVTVANGAGLELVATTIAGRTLIANGTGVGGTGVLQASGTSAWSGPITLASASTISSSGTLTLAGVLSGGATLTKSGAGTVVLSGANTWTGDLLIAAGTVAVSGGSAIDDLASVTLANVAGATFATNASETIGSLAGGGVVGGNVSLGANTLTLGGNNSATTFAGALSGSGSLVKAGTGTFTLSGTSTASGPTALSAGTLTIDGVIVSAVTAADGTALAGSGTLNAGATLLGASLRPGTAGAGTLSLATLNLSATSVLDFDLGTLSDRAVVAGNVLLDGTLNVTALSGFGAGTYPLITAGGTVTDQGVVFGTMPGGFTYQLVLSTGTLSLVVGAQTVQVTASDANAAEAGLDPGEFTVTRTGTNGDLVVAYTVSGSASAGADYVTLSGTVTILDGATSATMAVTPIDDSINEFGAPETITVTLQAGAYVVGASSTASVDLVSDDNQVTVAFASSSQNLPPGTTTVTIPVELTPVAAGVDVTVNFTIAGSLTNLGDQVITPNPLVIPAGATTADIVITLAATPWSVRTLTVTLSGQTNADLGPIAVHTVNVASRPESSNATTVSNCGLGSGLAVMLLMMTFGLMALRLRQR